MTRVLSLGFLTILFSSLLLAQDLSSDSETTTEMKIQRSLRPDSSGVADLLPEAKADRLILYYSLLNDSEREMQLARVDVTEQINCDVAITSRPESQVAAGGATRMVIEVRPRDGGPASFTVSMMVDDRPYTFPVQATVTAVLHWSISAHGHDHDDDHCSTGQGGSWLLMGGVAALLTTVLIRRRAA